jgi:gephyrin
MLVTSFEITPYAAMARPVAGVRGRSLIIAVPGSPKAAKENLEAVIKLLPHACDLAAGANSRTMHAERSVADSGKEVMTDRERMKAAPASPMKMSPTHSPHHHHHHHGHTGATPRTTDEQRRLLSNEPGAKGSPFR